MLDENRWRNSIYAGSPDFERLAVSFAAMPLEFPWAVQVSCGISGAEVDTVLEPVAAIAD
jgi:hypothetical protein